MAAVEIVSFGFLHAPAPEAHIVLDLREAFRDPHVDPALRQLTAVDRAVQQAVRRTPGVRRLLRATTRQAVAFTIVGAPLVIAVGCAGGRHRSAFVADQLARRLRRRGHRVAVHHRDINQPVINRPLQGVDHGPR